MAKEGKFFHESLQDSSSIKEYLQSLQEGLANGKISLSSESEDLELFPPHIVRLSIKAKKKGDNCKLQIKISWEETETASASQSSFSISFE